MGDARDPFLAGCSLSISCYPNFSTYQALSSQSDLDRSIYLGDPNTHSDQALSSQSDLDRSIYLGAPNTASDHLDYRDVPGYRFLWGITPEDFGCLDWLGYRHRQSCL
ncbi:MAG: hypothetical protein VKK05_08940 [Synechococcus sp.]|nr:hypothetical protein [Synechococcus sp.]